jgi:hypothetical protein
MTFDHLSTRITGVSGAGEAYVEWEWGGVLIRKRFTATPTNVVAWFDPPSVVVVEAISDGEQCDNAVVFDPDGSERLRLQPPTVGDAYSRIGFYTVYVSGGLLVAVFSTRAGDFWGVPDLLTGELRNVRQWR